MAIRLSGIKIVFILAGLGLAGGLVSAVVSSQKQPAQPPAFEPASNPYADGIFANGIVESDQPHGSNVNLYPEVSGTVVAVPVRAGQAVKRGEVLVQLDDRVQRATTEQLEAQARAAQVALEELKAQPRPETRLVVEAQFAAAQASAKQARDTYEKLQQAADIDPHAVSRDALDTARNAWLVADSNRVTAQRSLELTRAGAWSFDIRNQEATAQSLSKSAQSARTLLSKYTLRAPADGTVLSVGADEGSYVSPQGLYDTYTQAANDPLVVFGASPKSLQVRCYVDEILIPRLAGGKDLKAQMTVRGTQRSLPIEFVRIEPYVTPKISLSDERQERVDLRVLPVIFRFAVANGAPVYPGQLVDVYIGK
jgi:HlyD family secretion protein